MDSDQGPQTSAADDNVLKKLLKAYNTLVEVRKNAIGVVVGKEDVENKDAIAGLEKYLRKLDLNSVIGTSRIRESYMIHFRKEKYHKMIGLMTRIRDAQTSYGHYTQLRSRYGILAPIAFCEEADLPARVAGVGGDKSGCDLTLTWVAEFGQLSSSDGDTGLLDVVGVDYMSLKDWWNGGEHQGKEETRVWMDVKKLASKLVTLFDTFKQEEKRILALPPENAKEGKEKVIEGKETVPCGRVDEVMPSLLSLAQHLVRLLYIRKERTQDILPLFEHLVPLVFASEFVISYSDKLWETLGLLDLGYLSRYTKTLCSQKDELVQLLEAVDEIGRYSEMDSKLSPMSPQTIPKAAAKLAEEKGNEMSTIMKETVKGLKELGIEEMSITLSSSLDKGSFGSVAECCAEKVSQKLAVKFLNSSLPNDPLRIKNRLLREAASWSKLHHENINTLIGFCVHPDYEFPGLLSHRCETSLYDFLRTSVGKGTSHSERLNFMYDIACGLDYMHKMRVIHGDLRPPNVLIKPHFLGIGYTMVLSDFGASYPDGGPCKYYYSTLMHTSALYIAPELFAKRNKKGDIMVSRPGDVYAFGCVFLETVCDLSPYSNGHVEKSKKSGLPPAPKEQVDSRFWAFLCQTWNSNPQGRPNADELLVHVQSFRLKGF